MLTVVTLRLPTSDRWLQKRVAVPRKVAKRRTGARPSNEAGWVQTTKSCSPHGTTKNEATTAAATTRQYFDNHHNHRGPDDYYEHYDAGQ